MGLVETILEEYQTRDPYLLYPEEFDRFFEKEYSKLLKKAEKEAEKKMKLLVRVFTAPTIVWKSPWMNDIPKWLFDYIKIDRLIALMKNQYDGMATDSEALCYIIPRTFEAPLGHEWTRIYLYLGTKVMRQAKHAKLPEDIVVEQLDEYEQRLLNDLKSWIWEKQSEALRQRRRQRKQSINPESRKYHRGEIR